jgi:hypothetical protein
MMRASRCQWVNLRNPLYVKYHDEEWGVPSRDDAYLYEMLLLEMFVAGLSWECVLNKRESFRAAFAGFNPSAVAVFGEGELYRPVRGCVVDALGIGLDNHPFIGQRGGDLKIQRLVADKTYEGCRLGLVKAPLLTGPRAVKGHF